MYAPAFFVRDCLAYAVAPAPAWGFYRCDCIGSCVIHNSIVCSVGVKPEARVIDRVVNLIRHRVIVSGNPAIRAFEKRAKGADTDAADFLRACDQKRCVDIDGVFGRFITYIVQILSSHGLIYFCDCQREFGAFW